MSATVRQMRTSQRTDDTCFWGVLPPFFVYLLWFSAIMLLDIGLRFDEM
jgi:hypothetical protein